MIRWVSFSDFRGFHRLRVGPFKRLNLIVGKNNAGKSSLLEGLFLLAGPTNPELPMRLSAIRGVEQFRNDAEEVWGWLFNRRKTDRPIQLEAGLPLDRTRMLTITIGESKGYKLRPRKGDRPGRRSSLSTSATERPVQLDMRYRDESGKTYVTSAVLKEASIEFQRDEQARLENTIYISSRGGVSAENAERYSRLEEVGREGEILEAMKRLEPRLKRLAVLVTGSGPVVHGDLGFGHMVPVHFMGEGFGRLLTTLLAMAASPKGMTLIDEIEAGLHYSAMVQAWEAVEEMSRRENVQVMATTHNYECLKAAQEVFGETDEFAVFRLDRTDDEVEAVEFTTEMMGIALDTGLEVR